MYVDRKLSGSPRYSDKRGAVGRNGWFKPVGVALFASEQEEHITLEFLSSKGSPASVNLSNAEMRMVGELIVAACKNR